MKLNLRHVSVAGALLAISSTAFADLTQTDVNNAQGTTADTLAGAGQASSTTFSSLIFFAYNPDGSFSHVQTLGLRGGANAAASPAFSNPLTDAAGTVLNFSLNNAAGLNANSGNLLWGIMSYDSQGNDTSNAGLNLLSTVNSASVLSGGGAVLPNTASVRSTGNSVRDFLVANALGSDSVSSTNPTGTDNWALNNLNTATLTSTVGAAASAGSTLAMYLFSNVNNSDTSTLATATAYAGIWALNALTGTLTYSVGASAVPVPAAVWLLLSGLGGLGVVGRRRSALVAA